MEVKSSLPLLAAMEDIAGETWWDWLCKAKNKCNCFFCIARNNSKSEVDKMLRPNTQKQKVMVSEEVI